MVLELHLRWIGLVLELHGWIQVHVKLLGLLEFLSCQRPSHRAWHLRLLIELLTYLCLLL